MKIWCQSAKRSPIDSWLRGSDPDQATRSLGFWGLGWGDAEAAELRLALQYAAAKCAFPKGRVCVNVTYGNPISEKARATLPPRKSGDFSGERAVWEGKFCIT